jgi:hypothetical protein
MPEWEEEEDRRAPEAAGWIGGLKVAEGTKTGGRGEERGNVAEEEEEEVE